MTEQTTGRPQPYTAVLAYLTPAELPPGAPDSPLVVTTDPPAVFVRGVGQWVPVASVEGNIPAPTVVHATEDAAGIAETATQEETNAGADASRIVTPARLAGRTATEARPGLVELATAAETSDGTAATRAVHPAGLKAALASEAVRLVGVAGQPAFQNGWTNFGGAMEVAGFYKDPLGMVHVRGAIKNGSVGTVAFTLPAGYRPSAELVFATARSSSDLNAARITVTSGGVVEVTNGLSTQTHLSGVSFRAAQ